MISQNGNTAVRGGTCVPSLEYSGYGCFVQGNLKAARAEGLNLGSLGLPYCRLVLRD